MRLRITTKEENFFDDEVKFVTLKTSEGELGIYEGHTPLTAQIVPCPIAIDQVDKPRKICVCLEGYLCIDEKEILVMTDKVIWAADLDSLLPEEYKKLLSERKIAKYQDRNEVISTKIEIQKRIDELNESKQ